MSVTDQELEELARSGEAERVERKPSTRQKNDIRDAICAFANDLPGYRKPGVVFVGVNDDGSCANLPISDELLRELADLRSDGNILPPPTMSVERRTVHGCEVAAIVVEPSKSPPVRVRGRTMIRVGTRRGIATLEEEQRLIERARSRIVPFDISPVPGSSVADLDLDLFERVYLPSAIAPEILAENRRPAEAQLVALNLATTEGEATVLGLLAVGRNPLTWLPGAFVQFVRVAGEHFSDPIKDQKRALAPMPELLRIADELLHLWIEVETDIVSQAIEQRRPAYPLVALQQLTWNAVMHRTYEGTNAPVMIRWFDDRVEIHSPGGPYGKVTKDNFGTPGITEYRNAYLASVMQQLGYAQRFGFGIQIAREALARNGNPPPEFTVTDTHVLVTLRRRP